VSDSVPAASAPRVAHDLVHAVEKLVTVVSELTDGYRAMATALKRIAYEPFGPSDASPQEVLDLITAFARDAYEKAGAL
jgi:hypothetical protein